jgi:hypothetical protein
MSIFLTLPKRLFRGSTLPCGMLSVGLLVAPSIGISAQAPSSAARSQTPSPRAHHVKKQKPAPEPVVQTPPPPPMPHWPVNDQPSPASVVWDANGLRINASNSSLQQILNEVATETGSKVEGPVPDQRIYGEYGPGQARDVLSQLLQGSGYNVLLAGDLGKGAPREIVLSPRQAGPANQQNPNAYRPQQNPNAYRPQQDPDEEIPDQPEEQPQPPVPPPQQQMQNNPSLRPGFGPNGPIRTPQQVMEEMQQRQLLQQQQMQQQQQQQQNPQE